MNEFKNRVFGCAIVKAINANYNADFTHQPRTLPDGTVYATDKAFKYSVRHYLNHHYENERIFYYKRLKENLNPHTLDESYVAMFGDYPKIQVEKKKQGGGTKIEEVIDKKGILKNLLTCIDIRLFGATFAGETNVSIHGPVQVNHAMNRFTSGEIYSEQIMSPFRNPEAEGKEEREASTLGQQSKLREGHYVHHFSVNPQNLDSLRKLADNTPGLSTEDIAKLKEAMRSGVTYYDSASKAGTENELLLWVQLKQGSRAVLPVFTEFIQVSRDNGKVVISFGVLRHVINNVSEQVDMIEVYYNPENTEIEALPENVHKVHITTAKAL
jgi:CRISPR-associated protein Csh2